MTSSPEKVDVYKKAEIRLRNAPNCDLFGLGELRPFFLERFLPNSLCEHPDNAILGPSVDLFGRSVQTYFLKGHPGAVYIPTALPEAVQVVLANEALRAYPTDTNETNISRLSHQRYRGRGAFWPPVTAKGPYEELRWATLGHQYNWTTRSYDKLNAPFPQELSLITLEVLEAVARSMATGNDIEKRIVQSWGCLKGADESTEYSEGLCDCAEQPRIIRYVPNSGILNLYRRTDRLRGHKDDADDKLPLVSISLGLPAIFLLGSLERSGPVTPLAVGSGDILILGGLSRYAYHGLPRLLIYEKKMKTMLAQKGVSKNRIASFAVHASTEKNSIPTHRRSKFTTNNGYGSNYPANDERRLDLVPDPDVAFPPSYVVPLEYFPYSCWPATTELCDAVDALFKHQPAIVPSLKKELSDPANLHLLKKELQTCRLNLSVRQYMPPCPSVIFE